MRLILLVAAIQNFLGFVFPFTPTHSVSYPLTALHLRNFGDEPLKKAGDAISNPVAGTAAGAVLGGLLLGPFGALWGASVGSSMGAKSAVEKERKESMRAAGITEDMERMALVAATDLEIAKQGLDACRNSATSQKSLAKRLDEDQARMQNQARGALEVADEEMARKILLERERLREKLKVTLKRLVEENGRVEEMERTVGRLEERALEVDALIRRSVAANAANAARGGDVFDGGNDYNYGLELEPEDPLLKKFKDLEGK